MKNRLVALTLSEQEYQDLLSKARVNGQTILELIRDALGLTNRGRRGRGIGAAQIVADLMADGSWRTIHGIAEEFQARTRRPITDVAIRLIVNAGLRSRTYEVRTRPRNPKRPDGATERIFRRKKK